VREVKKAGVCIDAWKLPIFERHLTAGNYLFKNCGQLLADTLLLQVDVLDGHAQRLAQTVLAANQEAARTGRPK
jgi:hypothetical protein